jgi:hypothetical protein
MNKEVQKANDEIKMLEEEIDTWYHYKFILIGGLVAIFLGQTGGLGGGRNRPVDISDASLGTVFTSTRAALVLALACVIALAVDMHIRNNFFGMQQLGYWLSTRVEPKGEIASRFWETFLRGESKHSMQNSLAIQMLYGIQVHFLTIFVYLLYLSIFQGVSLFVQDKGKQTIALATFLMVHLTVIAFIILVHTVPAVYNVSWFPGDCSICTINESLAAIPYAVAWVVLILLNLPYLIYLFPSVKSAETLESDHAGLSRWKRERRDSQSRRFCLPQSRSVI